MGCCAVFSVKILALGSLRPDKVPGYCKVFVNTTFSSAAESSKIPAGVTTVMLFAFLLPKQTGINQSQRESKCQIS